MQMILVAIQEDQHELRAEIAKLRVTLRTAFGVLAVIASALAWLVDMAMRIEQ